MIASPNVKLDLPLEDVSLLVQGLVELPYRRVAHLVQRLEGAAALALSPPTPPVEAPPLWPPVGSGFAAAASEEGGPPLNPEMYTGTDSIVHFEDLRAEYLQRRHTRLSGDPTPDVTFYIGPDERAILADLMDRGGEESPPVGARCETLEEARAALQRATWEFRRVGDGTLKVPLSTDPSEDYAAATILIGGALAQLDESLPNAQLERTLSAYAALEYGARALGAYLRRKEA